MTPDTALPGSAELPNAAAAEARSAAPAPVSSIAELARARLVTVTPSATLAEVATLLSHTQIGMAAVCDADGVITGIITETLVVRQLARLQSAAAESRAHEVMEREFAVCAADEPLAEVLALMHRRGLLHMTIVDVERRPIGVINARDGLRALLAAGNHEEALLRDYVMGIGYQ